MKHKLAFLLAVFAATVLLLAVQKPVFLAWYAVGRGFTAADWWQVVRHGLALDMTVAGYVTALPVLAVLLSLWVRLPERPMRWLLTGYFIAVSVVVAAIFAVDLALYEHWGFRIDGTILIYLADPREAMASVCFSSEMLLNHAAINPVFSFLSTLGEQTDYAAEYPFFDERTRAQKFDAVRGNRPGTQPAERLLRTARPNVAVIILESFGRTVMDAQAEGEPVMPCMQRLKEQGVWFENFFANSFRTDRGEVAILSGFPAQTRISVMKLPGKSRSLPSIARSLGREGYRTRFVYGGDLNFTDQASYMYATGWQQLFWQKDFDFDTPPADWGYDDRVMCEWFGEQVIRWSAEGEPFLAGLLTLSSHPPFDVPYAKFGDRMFNATAFTDECVGRMIERWKASPAWDDLLVVLVADHSVAYPPSLAYNEPLRHRIPMIWTGGALATPPRVVEEYASQIDLCATLLGQLGVPHDDFDYSKDIFDPALPKFAYYTFNDGFGVVDASGRALYDAATGQAAPGSDPRLEETGRTLLQTTYVDIGRR